MKSLAYYKSLKRNSPLYLLQVMFHKVGIVSLVILSFSCVKEPIIHSYSFLLNVKLPQDVQLDSYAGFEVVLENLDKKYLVSSVTDAQANASWQGLEAGLYKITVVHQTLVNQEIQTFNGIATLKLSADAQDTIQLFTGHAAKFVIREFYYSGSNTPSGDNAYSSDQYIEVYNNTDEILYADGLSIVEHESIATAINSWDNMEEYIVVKAVWTVPGNGLEYHILPGHGFIIAQDAFDHRSDFNGNPNSPVDFGDADFEFWSDFNMNGDVDFAADNMIEDFWVFKANDMTFHNRGGSGIALVWLPADKQSFILNNLLPKGKGNNVKYYCKIPNTMVEDAVEAMWSDRNYKRFHASLDAGYVAVDAGSKSGLCIRRKIKEKINGRTIYMDTNNSSVDFDHDVVPAPRNYDL